MKTPSSPRLRAAPVPRRSMAGVSIVELMIAIALGLVILAGLVTIFANSSAARTEMERSSRQIENGRFAIELLAEDIRMAGFYGELNVASLPLPTDPLLLDAACTTDPGTWANLVSFHLMGFDDGLDLPPCMPAIKAGTDVLVVRRTATCFVGAPECSPATAATPLLQVTRCGDDPAEPTKAFQLGLQGDKPFDLRRKGCVARAGLRAYVVRMYFIGEDNGAGQPIPTLNRLEFLNGTWTVTPLVEGIENLQLEYGIDFAPIGKPDGQPDAYTPRPKTLVHPACTDPIACTPLRHWMNAMTVRVHLLARNIEETPNYVDPKTYTLGRNAAGELVQVTPGGPYKRHAFTTLVRAVNPAQRRETP